MMPASFGLQPLEYLTEGQMRQIHATALRILAEIGSVILHEPTQQRLRDNGATIGSDSTVSIPEHLVNQAIETSPRSLTIYNRLQQPAMTLEETRVYFGTGPDCQYCLDPDSGEPQAFDLAGLKRAVVLADALPQIDFVMSMALAAEVGGASADLIKFCAMLENTAKPLVLATGPELSSLQEIVERAAGITGNMDRLQSAPFFMLLVDPTSPLVHTADAIEKLIFMARNRLPVIYAPGIMAGATSPVTIAGSIAQAAAESLAGLVVHQLTQPGAPFVFGGGMSPLDMKSGQPTFAAPEAMVAQAGLCQLGRNFYRLPTWGFGGCSASKVCDEQAVAEASNYLMMSAWMGCNLVHDIGYLEFGRTYSLELLTICDEIIGQIRHLMAGIDTSDEQLAFEVVKRVGPRGGFLGDPHTFKHFRNQWQPDLIDRNARDFWKRAGSTCMLERARQKLKNIQADRKPFEDAVFGELKSQR